MDGRNEPIRWRPAFKSPTFSYLRYLLLSSCTQPPAQVVLQTDQLDAQFRALADDFFYEFTGPDGARARPDQTMDRGEKSFHHFLQPYPLSPPCISSNQMMTSV